ncbi:hypothetical protein [Parasitella parasitica]|uniref:Uncharacterized protein n=1 Tax=Parasitella parasitica TaxID=35722 RepID=A0A0B7NMX8_9FUNG|nr:hypothetical protein [Parasitella parasitica]
MNPSTIDGSLYQVHIDIQLRQLENDASIIASKKEPLRKILQSLKQVDGNTLYPIFNDIFYNSVDYRSVNSQVDRTAYASSTAQVQAASNNEKVNTATTEPQSEPQPEHKQNTSKHAKGKNKQIKVPTPAKNKGKRKSNQIY